MSWFQLEAQQSDEGLPIRLATDFPTLQAAVDSLPNSPRGSGTILLPAGRYLLREPLALGARIGLQIIGENAIRTSIEAGYRDLDEFPMIDASECSWSRFSDFRVLNTNARFPKACGLLFGRHREPAQDVGNYNLIERLDIIGHFHHACVASMGAELNRFVNLRMHNLRPGASAGGLLGDSHNQAAIKSATFAGAIVRGSTNTENIVEQCWITLRGNSGDADAVSLRGISGGWRLSNCFFAGAGENARDETYRSNIHLQGFRVGNTSHAPISVIIDGARNDAKLRGNPRHHLLIDHATQQHLPGAEHVTVRDCRVWCKESAVRVRTPIEGLFLSGNQLQGGMAHYAWEDWEGAGTRSMVALERDVSSSSLDTTFGKVLFAPARLRPHIHTQAIRIDGAVRNSLLRVTREKLAQVKQRIDSRIERWQSEPDDSTPLKPGE